MPRYARARDANEPEIRKALIAAISTIAGITDPQRRQLTVIRIDQPCDLLVGIGRRVVFLEVKNPERRGVSGGSGDNRVKAKERANGGEFEGFDVRLTRAQCMFIKYWPGPTIHQIETVEQAMLACGICTCCRRAMAGANTPECPTCNLALASCERAP